MALWVDKHRPKQLKELSYHREQADQLQSLVSAGDFPHLLFYGPSGAGKKTRVSCLLRELYGAGVEHLRLETKQFETPSGKKLELQAVSSNFHIELCPGDAGFYDRVVVQDVVKQMAQTQQINSAAQRNFKVVVLLEVDRLSRDAQHALRRTMEKYTATCRLILVCQSISKVIDPLRSRCMSIRVPAPSTAQTVELLYECAKNERVDLPQRLATTISLKSAGNTRRSLLMLETCKVQNYPLKDDQPIPEPEWELYLKETAQQILKEQSPECLFKVRDRLYECISRCIPPNIIFVHLTLELIKACNTPLRCKVVALAAEYEHRLTRGNKAIFHLEAFVAAFMCDYKDSLEQCAMEH